MLLDKQFSEGVVHDRRRLVLGDMHVVANGRAGVLMAERLLDVGYRRTASD
jgi:hypothetical protein